MSYGQKNYLEIQGISGKYRISQIGCFITAFANLLDRFGKGVGSPIEVNRILRDGGFYVDVDDGVRDDVGYTTVSKVNGNVVVTHTGVGTPPHNNCIVKFSGLESKFGTHFCLVADAAQGLIVDSWDGQVKSWDEYGGVKEWAAYEDRSPAPQPAPAPSVPEDSLVVQAGWGVSHVAKAAGYADYTEVSRWDYLARINGYADHSSFRLSPNQVVKVRGADPAAAPAPAPQNAPEAPQEPEVVSITVQAGWGVTQVLKAAGYSQEQFERPEEWDRLAALNGSSTRLRLQPSQVVKVYRTPLPVNQPVQASITPEVPATPAPVAPPVVPAAENSDGAVSVPVTVIRVDPNAYKSTLQAEEKVYIAATSKVIKDMDGLGMDLQLVAGQKVTSGGAFEKEEIVDGQKVMVQYILSKSHYGDGKNVKWYGINKDFLGTAKDPNAYVGQLVKDDEDEDDDLFDLDLAMEAKEAANLLTSREKLIDLIGKLFDAFTKLKFWNKKKAV